MPLPPLQPLDPQKALPAASSGQDRKHLIPRRRFVRDQRRHFGFAVVLPTVFTLSGPLWLPGAWLDWHWAALGLLMWWLVGCWGVTVGLHRLYAHRSFSAPAAVRWLLGGLGSMAAQGSVVYWVALHRCHHTLSDQEGDPHSPSPSARPGQSARKAFWQGHVGWAVSHDVPKPTRYAAELLADPVANSLAKHYWAWVWAGIALPAALGAVWVASSEASSLAVWQGALIGAWWGGPVRIALGHHVIWSINSVCHRYGSRPHATTDTSTNNAWLSLISWGESWHNNHHASATSARLGRGVLQPDIGWWCVKLLAALGLAKAIRV